MYRAMPVTATPPLCTAPANDWLTDRSWFEVRDSGTHGRGVYALRAVPARIPLFEMGGPTIRRTQELEPGQRALQIGEDLWVIEDTEADYPENYLNHACFPNLGFAQGDLVLWSLRPIRPGDELTWDYSTSIDETGWHIECACGHADCRGRVEAFHALPHEQRRRLAPTSLEWLRERYAV